MTGRHKTGLFGYSPREFFGSRTGGAQVMDWRNWVIWFVTLKGAVALTDVFLAGSGHDWEINFCIVERVVGGCRYG